MIAIKGMEMPVDCFHCCFEVNNHCHVDVDIRRVEPIGRPDWCPLVEAVTHEDYLSMQQTCFKLQKALAEAAPHNNPEDSIREVKP